MPLSDHEQRLLDEIEQALYAEDPKFASTVGSAGRRSRVRRVALLAGLGVVTGLGLVLVGLMANLIVLSVVGFVLVVAACGFVVRGLRPRIGPATAEAARTAGPARGPKPTQPRSGGLRSRMEDRLRRRFEEN